MQDIMKIKMYIWCNILKMLILDGVLGLAPSILLETNGRLRRKVQGGKVASTFGIRRGMKLLV